MTMLRFGAEYFEKEFHLSSEIAGLLIFFFSASNLFARSLGGF